jgi:serine/threonine protein kinase
MQGPEEYVGQTLDDKYRLEQMLGRGGMGAVYLASHLGTERYVALKLISPQFMRNREFVERFKREARAAGRLRHPNVVDVTDFGFARVKEGQVAYLVMEYLDGCTLGDVLAEEKRLPLEWVADILEQVCSAVHEAHQQGIVHRDLKPDNIWLEPNRLGSYRVKVLDFGIAKLGAAAVAPVPDEDATSTIIDNVSAERAAEALTRIPGANLETDTLMRPTGDAVGTFLQNEKLTQPFAPGDHPDAEDDGTLLFDDYTRPAGHDEHATTAAQGPALTRVGAIMGTPLYMSPEQCGGGFVDMRSDIYSLGVIAYQMLAGEPPFAGNTSTVMRAHREQKPADLRERSEKKIPKRVARVVMSALSKNPAERPQTAFALGSALRAESEGIGALYRRAFALYSEYFPKFLKLSFLAHIPVIVTTLLMIGLSIIEQAYAGRGAVQKIVIVCAIVIVGILQIVALFIAGGVISGVTAVIITQLTAAPLRPVQLRVAFRVLRKRWKPFLKTMVRVSLRIVIGFILLIIPGVIMMIRYSLYSPVVLIEGLEKKAAMRRARELASRSWRTIIIVTILQILIPSIISGFLSALLGQRLSPKSDSLSRRIFSQILNLNQIFVLPLMSIVPALLYLKMRQLGGEPMSAALAQIEAGEDEQSNWQQRIRTRLSLHTPVSQKTTGGG